jgi:HSP20 family molecular chaperone IbpA
MSAGERKVETETKDKTKSERYYGHFQRAYRLPDTVH